MNKDPIEEYLSFNFFSNSQFISHFERLYPTPNQEQMERIKRKWFQKNINPLLDIDFVRNSGNSDKKPDDSKQKDENPRNNDSTQNFENNKSNGDDNTIPTNSSNQPNPDPDEKPVQMPFFQNVFFTIEAYLKFSFMLSYLGFRLFANYLGITISILALIRQGKFPRFTKEYARKILTSEHFHNLFFFGLFSFYPDFLNFLYFLPMMVHCWIGLCNFAFLKKGKIYNAFRRHVDTTRKKEKNLVVLKQKIEIFLLAWLIFKIIFSTHFSATLLLYYGLFIRLKYHLNENMEKAFDDIDVFVRGYVEDRRCPGFVRKIYGKFKALCSYTVRLNNN